MLSLSETVDVFKPALYKAQRALIGQLIQCIVIGQTPQAVIVSLTPLNTFSNFSFQIQTVNNAIGSENDKIFHSGYNLLY